MLKVNIRRATAEDYSVLCDLFDEVDALHRASLPQIFQRPNGPVREQDCYLGLVSDENVGLFVAEMGEKVAGFVHAVMRDAPSIPALVPRRYAFVETICVKSGFQDHGIGRRLMDTVHKWAIAKGATAIELNVYEFNKAAIAFYKAIGYETFSRRMRKVLDYE